MKSKQITPDAQHAAALGTTLGTITTPAQWQAMTGQDKLDMHAARAAAIQANNSRFSKGQEAIWVSIGHSSSEPTQSFWLRKIQLTSMGKQQGSAVYANSGANVQMRIFKGHTIILADESEVTAFSQAYGTSLAVQDHQRRIEMEAQWLVDHANTPVSQKHIPAAQEKLAKMKVMTPRVEVSWY